MRGLGALVVGEGERAERQEENPGTRECLKPQGCSPGEAVATGDDVAKKWAGPRYRCPLGLTMQR